MPPEPLQFNNTGRELTIKVVYYGPGLSGRPPTSSALHERVAERRGKRSGPFARAPSLGIWRRASIGVPWGLTEPVQRAKSGAEPTRLPSCSAGRPKQRRQIREANDARLVARRSDEVLLEVLSLTAVVARGRLTGDFKHQYRSPSGELRAIILRNRGPLYSDSSKRQIVALVSPEARHRPVVLLDDLHPFQFHRADEELIRQRIAAASTQPAAATIESR